MSLALVTGATSPVGQAVSRRLSELGYDVVVCSRYSEKAGPLAARLGRGTLPLTLDLESRTCVKELTEFLQNRGQLEVVIHGAEIRLDQIDGGCIHRTLAVNTWGPARLNDGLKSFLSERGCIVLLSSQLASSSRLNVELRARLLDPLLSRDTIHGLASEFIHAANRRYAEGAEIVPDAFAFSKALLNGVTRVLAREWGSAGPRINAVCPDDGGPVQYGTSPSGTIEDLAEEILWAAQLSQTGQSGCLFHHKAETAW